jgi:hypothetical protein
MNLRYALKQSQLITPSKAAPNSSSSTAEPRYLLLDLGDLLE